MDIKITYIFTSLFTICFGNYVDVNTTDQPIASEIIGGQEADIKDFPFLVSLHYRVFSYQNGHSCCGFLLTPLWIGTAAHCLLNKKHRTEVLSTKHFFVLASTTDLINRDRNYQKRYPDSFVPHPRFSWSLLHNDIGLIRVSSPFDYNGQISLAILPSPDQNLVLDPWMECSVAGWGTTDKDDDKSISAKLMSVKLNIVPREACESGIGGSYFMNPAGSICTHSNNGAKDTCKGDSGSALICEVPETKGEVLVPELASNWVRGGWKMDDERHRIVVAIVSWSWECARKGIPAMNTDIRSYREWMEYTVLNYNKSAQIHFMVFICPASLLVHIFLTKFLTA